MVKIAVKMSLIFLYFSLPYLVITAGILHVLCMQMVYFHYIILYHRCKGVHVYSPGPFPDSIMHVGDIL